MWLDIPHSTLPSETLGYQPSRASLPVCRGGIAVFVGTPFGTPPKTRRLKAEPEDRHLSNLPNPSASLRSVRCRGHAVPAPFITAFNFYSCSMNRSSGLDVIDLLGHILGCNPILRPRSARSGLRDGCTMCTHPASFITAFNNSCSFHSRPCSGLGALTYPCPGKGISCGRLHRKRSCTTVQRNAGASLRTPGTKQLVRPASLAQITYPGISGCRPDDLLIDPCRWKMDSWQFVACPMVRICKAKLLQSSELSGVRPVCW